MRKLMTLSVFTLFVLSFYSSAFAEGEFVTTKQLSSSIQHDITVVPQQTFESVTDSNTTLIGRWANGPCQAVDVSGNIAYFGNGGYLEVVDFSDPANPNELGKVLTPSVVSGVAVSGSYAYVADKWDGLRIIDVSIPSNPTEAGFFDTGCTAWGVAVSGDLVYVADGYDGLYIIQNDMTSSVEDDKNLGIPIGFTLNQNYPNPFNPSGAGRSTETTISFLIPKISKVEISIYNIKGQKVKEVANNEFDKGIHSVVWNGDDEMGNPVSSGIYFYIMKTDNFLEIKKAILLK